MPIFFDMANLYLEIYLKELRNNRISSQVIAYIEVPYNVDFNN